MPSIPIQDDDQSLGILEGVFDFFKLYTSNKDISTHPLVGHIWAMVHVLKLSKGGTSLQRQKGGVARGLLLDFNRHWHTTTPSNHKNVPCTPFNIKVPF